MDDDAAKRFRARKNRLNRIRDEAKAPDVPTPPNGVVNILDSESDSDRVAQLAAAQESHYAFDLELSVSDAEVAACLDELRGRVSAREFDDLMEGAKQQVLDALIKPFGLAKILFQDHDGGNVTTIHNMKQGLKPANKTHKYDDEARDVYVKYKTSKCMDDYKKSRINVHGKIQDTYTGKFLDEIEDRVETDHVYPLKTFHLNGGFMLNDQRKADFASDRENFAVTKREINRSKLDQELAGFEAKTVQKKTASNKNRFDMDGRRTRAAAERGSQTAQKHKPTVGEKATFYGKEIVSTGASEATSMGVQQAIGLLLHELASGLIAEARDFFKQWRGGSLGGGVLQDLRERFQRIGSRLVRRWDVAFKAFVEGSISGFVSNLVTFVINTFLTTFRRVVRIIREGTLSLLRAFKLLLFPPKGMTRREAAHEASKIFAAGLAVAAGLGIEEFVSKSLLAVAPFIAPFADMIAVVVVGILTGIGSAILVYLLDRIDFFGVVESRRHALVMADLSQLAADHLAEAEEYMRVFDLPDIPPSTA
ncbi:MAG: hypothetical protein GC168_14860 [Candidatus Hydrogenedens sp.]|nr:hypothetical protein [Candidatus Hydrogenedens sp.]